MTVPFTLGISLALILAVVATEVTCGAVTVTHGAAKKFVLKNVLKLKQKFKNMKKCTKRCLN